MAEKACPVAGYALQFGLTLVLVICGESMSPVNFNGSQLQLKVTSLPEAKVALKELKLKKREFLAQKKQIIAQQKLLRAQYTHTVRTRSPMMRGGGTVGFFVRAFQTSARSSDRSSLATSLAPLENERNIIETRILNLESAILQVETYILKASNR